MIGSVRPVLPYNKRIKLRWLYLLLFLGLVQSFGAFQAAAQTTLRISGDAVPVSSLDDGYFLQPRWSPSGDRLAVSGKNYNGLWLIHVDSRLVRKLTDEKAAGFDFSWSRDATSLLTRPARFEGPRRQNKITIFDADTGAAHDLVDFRSSFSSIPRWSIDNAHVVLVGKNGIEVLPTGKEPAPGKNENSQSFFFADDNLVRRANLATGEAENVMPPESGTILNLVLSPDGTKVTYEIMGGDLIVADTDGSNRINLGEGYRPRWSPDSRRVVFMVSRDDGHKFVESDLIVARADGSTRVQLTSSGDGLEMNPDWSPDGKSIAYDDRGVIYVIHVIDIPE